MMNDSLKIVPHQFTPTTGSAAADAYIRDAVAEVMRDLTPLIIDRVTEKMAGLLEAKRMPRLRTSGLEPHKAS